LCTSTNCQSNNTNNCNSNSCRTPWVWNGTLNDCELYNSSAWILQDKSTDINGGIQSSASFAGSCSGSGGPGAWQYTFFGNQTGNQPMIFSDTMGISIPHYQIRIIYWMIQIDNWQNNDVINSTINSTSLNFTNSDYRNNGFRQQSSNVCGGGAN
jgi:hypothetical protein